MPKYDAIIIGSGPNGIAAAIRLQQEGCSTLILEQAAVPGGGTKTEELTLPGFKHDLCSSIHPLTFDSPFFRTLPLEKHGLEWVHPDIPFAHPFLDGDAFACYNNISTTAQQLGIDAAIYENKFASLLESWQSIEKHVLAPLHLNMPLIKMARFGIDAFKSAHLFNKSTFSSEKTKAFFYGAAAHSTLPLTHAGSAAFGLLLFTMAHKGGWPFPKGGAAKINEALLSYYQSLGGELQLNYKVKDIKQLPEARAYLFDVTPKQLLKIKGTQFSRLYKYRLSNYKYGAGVFKMDWALNAPIPWTNNKCRKAGTIHLGYSTKELEYSEKVIYKGKITERPYVLLAQHSVFDENRAPVGKHTAWAYCHVPNGSTIDMTGYIEDQIERAAPGFKDTILARSTKNTQQMQEWNPNLINGDINGGKNNLAQIFTRPIIKANPYQTSTRNIYICSSSTPPGGGVHGMCGFNAAENIFKRIFQ